MPTQYTVTIGNYTNKKNVTKQWLFIKQVGNDWQNVLLSPGQCRALLDNIDKLQQFAAPAVNGSAHPQPQPSPVVVPMPQPEPTPAPVVNPKQDKPAPITSTGAQSIVNRILGNKFKGVA